MTGGRPLRFLAVVIFGWAGARTLWLWPLPVPPRAAAYAARAPDGDRATPASPPRPQREPPSFAMAAAGPRHVFAPSPAPIDRIHAAPGGTRMRTVTVPSLRAADAAMSIDTPQAEAAPAPADLARTPGVSLPAAPPTDASPSRLTGSAWAILRDGGGGGDFAGGRLGAAQAGARLTYALGASRRIAVAGRLSSPIDGRGREGAVGLDWRPTRLPVHIVAEQRFGLDRAARSGPAVSMIGGIDPLPIAAGFRLEGYGQAGVARLGAFADGGVRLARPVARAGGLRLDLGVGAWGGAQPGVSRVDVGPGATLVVPVADRALRLALDWRQRVAGRAAPGSGPALSIGSDF